MPFGKYRGWEIAALPDDYLAWLLTIELYKPLYDAVAGEYQRRLDEYDLSQEGRTPPPPGLRLRVEEAPLARRMFDAGYRTLARTLHPDHGGDADQMRQLNLLSASLRAQLGALEGTK